MLVPVVLVLLLLRSAVAVVARILLAFWGRHVASVHARNQEVPRTASIETDAAPGSRCLAPSLLLRILVSPQDRVPPLLQGLAQTQSRQESRAHAMSTSNLRRTVDDADPRYAHTRAAAAHSAPGLRGL